MYDRGNIQLSAQKEEKNHNRYLGYFTNFLGNLSK